MNEKEGDMISAQVLADVEQKVLKKYSRAYEVAASVKVHAGYNKISEYAMVQLFDEAREAKYYKGLPYTDDNGNQCFIETIQQYCDLILGVSYTVLAEKSQRLAALGEEAFKGAGELGLTRKMLRTIDRLPADKQEVMRMALAAKNKTQVTELLEDVMTRNTAAEAASNIRITELEKEQVANEQLIRDKDLKINEYEKRQRITRTWEEDVYELNIETTVVASETLERLDRLDQLRGKIVMLNKGGHGEAAVEAAAVVYIDAINQLIAQVAEIRTDCMAALGSYANDARPMLSEAD